VESAQVLPDGVFASGEQIDRQIAADPAERGRITQPRRCAEEGNKRVGVKVFKAEGISHERIEPIGMQERRVNQMGCEETIEPAALLQVLRGQLDGYKVPKSVIVVDELPKTSTGKIQKNVVRDQHASHYGG